MPRGAGIAGAHPERGSQSLEFAMSLPLLGILLLLVFRTALLGADLVVAQGLAREAVRVAVVADDATTQAAVRAAAGAKPVELALDPPDGRVPGQLVTATLRLRSPAFAPLRVIWVPARATMRVETTAQRP